MIEKVERDEEFILIPPNCDNCGCSWVKGDIADVMYDLAEQYLPL